MRHGTLSLRNIVCFPLKVSSFLNHPNASVYTFLKWYRVITITNKLDKTRVRDEATNQFLGVRRRKSDYRTENLEFFTIQKIINFLLNIHVLRPIEILEVQNPSSTSGNYLPPPPRACSIETNHPLETKWKTMSWTSITEF